MIAGKLTEQAPCEILHERVIWNNKLICNEGKSVFYGSLFQKRISTLGDLAIEEGRLVTMGQILARTDFKASEKFQLMAIIDALPFSERAYLLNHCYYTFQRCESYRQTMEK